MRAVALGGVERETVRSGLLQRYAAVRVHQVLGEMLQRVALRIVHGQRTFSQVEGGHHGVTDALLIAFARFQFVHHELYEVGLVAVHGLHLLQVDYLGVYAHLDVSFLPELLEEFSVVALAAPDERSQQHALAAVVVGQYHGDYLLIRVSYHLLAGGGGIGA